MGNYHARFLGGWARATAPGYPPWDAPFERPQQTDCSRCRQRNELAYMDPSSVASIPFFGNEVRLLTYIRPPTAASL